MDPSQGSYFKSFETAEITAKDLLRQEMFVRMVLSAGCSYSCIVKGAREFA